MALEHDRTFDARHGAAVPVAPGVVRVTCNNPGPFTFEGTNSYLVGEGPLVVIDPGPEDAAHHEALMAAIGGRRVSHILITHTHLDHSPGARALKTRTGAETVGAGRHRPARPPRPGEEARLDAGGDMAFEPDVVVSDGTRLETPAGTFEVVATPGHTANHVAFALAGPEGILFSGDHVMAWSTTVVAPPDGSMADYMASIDKLIARDERIYFPGHGGPVTAPGRYVPALRKHRKMREAAILERLAAGERTIPDIVARLYADVDPRLHRAAGLSVLAHLEDLCDRGLVAAEPRPAPDAVFRRT